MPTINLIINREVSGNYCLCAVRCSASHKFLNMYNLPVDYTKLHYTERKAVRLQYIEEQKGLCYYCGCSLNEEAPQHIKDKKINWKLFPQNFLQYPIHLQHNHDTGMTEGAVHNYCNAVMWQYEGR